MLGCVGARSLAVLEHECRVEHTFAHQREGLGVVLGSLVVIADEQVGGQSAVGYDAAYCCHALQILLACVLAVHQLEYLCRAALCREVYVLAEVGLVGYGVQDVVGHVFGVGCGEADAHVGHALSHLVQQFGKRTSAFDALSGWSKTVAVDVLTQESHLLESLVVQILHLSQYAFNVARALTSSCVGHNAVVAEVVAASHDAHEAAHASCTDSLRNYVAVGFGGREFDIAGVLSVLALRYHVGQVEIRVGSAHEVGVVVVDKVLAHALSHTSQHAENELSTLLLFGMQRLEASIYLVLSILSDGASVEEYGVGAVLVVAEFVACHLHNGCYHFRVGHVHLAAVCLYE